LLAGKAGVQSLIIHEPASLFISLLANLERAWSAVVPVATPLALAACHWPLDRQAVLPVFTPAQTHCRNQSVTLLPRTHRGCQRGHSAGTVFLPGHRGNGNGHELVGQRAAFEGLTRLDGLEHLHRALAQGKGVILLSAHFTTLEIGGRLLSMQSPFHVMYRPHKNAAFESVLQAARTRHFRKAIPRGDLRGMLRSLKENIPVWYAPDQDYGREQSIFVPFFGIRTASITGTSRLARISKAPVVPFFQTRLPGAQGYQLTLYPALEGFPGDSIEADTCRISAIIEARVREQPGQYLWAHRRFKTRPEGEPGVYD